MNKYAIEAFATFILVFFGTGVIVVHQQYGGVVGHLGICIVWGIAVAVMIYAYGEASGAHMNPAVTVALWAGGLFPARQVLPYIVMQVLGAVAASGLLKVLFPANENLGATLPADAPWRAFVLEVVMTMVLLVTILRFVGKNPQEAALAGLVIGSLVALLALMGGPVSGTSLNPARSFGPALLSGKLEHMWLYAIAPTTGALLGVGIDKLLRK